MDSSEISDEQDAIKFRGKKKMGKWERIKKKFKDNPPEFSKH